MSLTVLMIDAPIAYARGALRETLLSLPLAETTVLEKHLAALGELVEKDVWVTLPSGVTPEYASQIAGAASRAVKVLSLDRVAALLGQAEPGDQLLVVQARHWLVSGYDVPTIRRGLRDYRGATFGVAIGTDAEAARERVEQDASGRVRRVQRLYSAVSWPETATSAVPFAFVPARSAAGIRMGSLVDLRFALSCRGVLTNDLPLQSEALDLTCEREFLAVNEQLTHEATQNSQAPAGFMQWAPGVLVGDRCKIHPSVRLVPPIIVHADAEICESGIIVGPSLIGRNCLVGSRATVAQAVLLPETSLRDGSAVRHGVSPSAGCGEGIDSLAPDVLANENALFGQRELAMSQTGMQGAVQAKLLHLAAKRALDIVSAVLALIVLSPLLLVVALMVRLDSPGPIFFSHRRERKGGKDFPCIKFRTMVSNAHQIQRDLLQNNEVDGPQFKMRDDPRVTRVGRWLRSTNIDELPQLINVLLGHMTLVGPRPSPFRENQICVPWRLARLSVRPGITGLWQLCRDESRQSDFHQWIFYDVAYVRHFSFWLDAKILLATLLTLGGRWSVPLSWILPAAQRSSTYARAAVV